MQDGRKATTRALRTAVVVLSVWGLAGVRVVAEPPQPGPPIPLSPEANEFLRAAILMLAPQSSVDEDDWGRTKRVQSGLNVRLDGIELRTSRRWKQVNHGEWNRVEVVLENPEQQFDLQIAVVPQANAAVTVYRLDARARVRLKGRQQRWSHGVKLYSASGEGIADLAMTADLELQRQVVQSDGSSRLRILPHVKSASVQLIGFQLRRVGHAKGALVRELGRSFQSIAKRLVARESNKLAAKLNKKIQKKPERFEIPLGVFGLLAGTSPVQDSNPAGNNR